MCIKHINVFWIILGDRQGRCYNPFSWYRCKGLRMTMWLAHCVNCFSHHCHQAPSRSKLRMKRFIMNYSFSSSFLGRLSEVHCGQSMGQGSWNLGRWGSRSLGLWKYKAIYNLHRPVSNSPLSLVVPPLLKVSQLLQQCHQLGTRCSYEPIGGHFIFKT